MKKKYLLSLLTKLLNIKPKKKKRFCYDEQWTGTSTF